VFTYLHLALHSVSNKSSPTYVRAQAETTASSVRIQNGILDKFAKKGADISSVCVQPSYRIQCNAHGSVFESRIPTFKQGWQIQCGHYRHPKQYTRSAERALQESRILCHSQLCYEGKWRTSSPPARVGSATAPATQVLEFRETAPRLNEAAEMLTTFPPTSKEMGVLNVQGTRI
jgi:hypothetical protein